jgi:dihydrofolate reductase
VPYDADAIRKVKAEASGDVYVSGSATLVRAMLADGLVDELHLLTYPVALGGGIRLFPEGAPRTTLRLVDSETYTNGVVHLTYAPSTA